MPPWSLISTAHFVIRQAFGARMLREVTIGIVVARRLLVRLSHGSIEAQARINLPIHASLGIEKMKVFVQIQTLHAGIRVRIILVICPLHAITDVAILQIRIGCKSFAKEILRTSIDIGISLVCFVAIVIVIGVKHTKIVFRPKHPAEMITDVFVGCSTQGSTKFGVAIIYREHCTCEMIVHCLFAHQVGTLHHLAIHLIGLHAIFYQFAVRLVLLIVTISLGVVRPQVCAPTIGEAMVKKQLNIGLHIVVRLIFVEVLHTLRIRIHITTRVVAASIRLHLLTAGIIPRMIRLLFTTECNESGRSRSTHPRRLGVERMQFCRSTIDVSISTDIGQTQIKSPMVFQQSCTYTQGLFMCEKRAKRSIHFSIRLVQKICGLQIQTCTESTCTVGRSTHTSLQLNVFHARCEVGHVYPKHRVALGIINWNTIGRNIDA